KLLACRIGKLVDGRLTFASNDETNERGKRWIEMRLTAGKLRSGKASVIVIDGGQDRIMVGRKRLHENAAPFIAAAGAAGDLGDELKRPLGCSQITKMERRIGVNDADERHIREIETLGDHLRAEQDFYLAGAKPRQC